MKEVLEALAKRLDMGKKTMMVTVIASHGSVPQGVGARMLVGEEGRIAGTVGGGVIEHQAEKYAREGLLKGGCFVRGFSLTTDQAGALGMVCGGQAEMLFQCVLPRERDLCRKVLEALRSGKAVYLQTDLDSGQMRLVFETPPLGLGSEDRQFVQRIDPGGRVYVFGGGHVARALAPLLCDAGFSCLVLDDRPEFLEPGSFSAADTLLLDFARLDDFAAGEEDYAVIMTRGHEHDLKVLSAVLKTPARYIGMMGSSHKRAFVYARLMEQGFGEEELQRVYTPVGLAIGAETPFEIAVSITAQLIACRAKSVSQAYKP
ncbi:MAG: XdhC family protein [Clostridia bacterium]|nr:XdhC family protein [Clostridia bacterium]